MPSQQDRHELHQALVHKLGQGPAATLMELLPPIDWAEFASRSDIAEAKAELKVDIAELRNEIAGVKGEIAGVKGEIAGVKGEIAELRSKIDGQVTRLVAANIPIMFGVAGLVLAAAKLA